MKVATYSLSPTCVVVAQSSSSHKSAEDRRLLFDSPNFSHDSPADEGLTNVRKEKLISQKYVICRESATSLLE